MRFSYKAQKAGGEFYEGEREAADRFALAHELKGAGETLIAASEAASRQFNFLKFMPRLERVSARDRIVFARNLSGMIRAGLTVSRSLSVLERQTRSRRMRSVIAGANARLSAGASLHQAFAEAPDVFSPLFVSMVAAGEESGNLASSLATAAQELEAMHLLTRRVRSALVYPAIVVTTMLALGVVLFIYVVPNLTATFTEFGVSLPLATRIVIAVSTALEQHAFFVLLALLLAAAAFVAAHRTERGKSSIDRLLLFLPIVKTIVRETNAARTCRTIGSLLSSGVEILIALDIAEKVVQNSQFKAVLRGARRRVEHGGALSAVFLDAAALYPPFVGEMAAVGEETGKLAEMLQGAGDFYDNEVAEKTKNLSTLIEPILIIVIGLAVGFFALAMITPTYSLMQSI